MYDVFLKGVEIARKKSNILERFKLKPNKYYLATIHRAENTDNKKRLGKIVSTFCKIKNLIFPCHPRTKKYLKQYKLWQKLNRKVKIIDPVGYLDMLWLEQNAKKILTDSGGIQKEAYWSKVPCITLMENTGWPETVKDGWNILVDVNPKKILRAAKKFFPRREQHKYFGDGKTAKRIIEILIKQRMK